jgi:hypothetical protein
MRPESEIEMKNVEATAMTTRDLVAAIDEAGQDFEWYPTTDRMIQAVSEAMASKCRAFSRLLDVGAGDGRVLLALERWRYVDSCGGVEDGRRDLFGIERSEILMQQWPERITPMGVEFFEQDLAALKVDVIFCNPPYSQFEAWACKLILSGHARYAYLVIPQRWKDSDDIQRALAKRGATATVIHSDDFSDAERRARAVVDIVEIAYPMVERHYRGEHDTPVDPFDAWFDEHFTTFDQASAVQPDAQDDSRMAKVRGMTTIAEIVEAYDEEYARMEENYRAIFRLDYQILKELGVKKEAIRDGLKERMAGLKATYWQLLFGRLDRITRYLCADTRKHFLERINGQAGLAFTARNAYAIVLWAVKHANLYYDDQLKALFKRLSTPDGVHRYKSNQRTWAEDGWRYMRDDKTNRPTHYALDYRIVVSCWGAIKSDQWSSGYTGELSDDAHDLIGDILVVLANLGFDAPHERPSKWRTWVGGQWQNWRDGEDRILVQMKAYKNGNVHLRFMPEAIKTLNVEAARLLGWIRSVDEAVEELGYSRAEVEQAFGRQVKLTPSNIKLLAAPVVAEAQSPAAENTEAEGEGQIPLWGDEAA